jgi:hypothetical protein
MMSGSRKTLVVLALVMFAVGAVGFSRVQLVRAAPVQGFVWEGDVYSSGTSVVSPVLEAGTSYVIQVQEIWFYDYANNLAADAMFYTTDPGDSWDWQSHNALAGNHSFLQIDSGDVNWGPFSNGDTGHKYAIAYIGNGVAINFRIVDWLDSNYVNNECHIHVKIYLATTVGGYIADYGVSNVYLAWMFGAVAFGVVVAGSIVAYCRRMKK